MERGFLFGSAGVGRVALFIQATFIADADGVTVVVLAVSTDDALGTTTLYGTITTDHIVVADARPASLAMPEVYLVCRGSLRGFHCRAVDD